MTKAKGSCYPYPMHDLLTQVDVARWLKMPQEWVLEHLQDCVALHVGGEPRWTKAEIVDHLRKLDEKMNAKQAAA